MVEPKSLKEAMSLLDPEKPTIRAVSGGTALMLMMKAGVFQPTRLICLHGIEPEHSRITVAGNALRIGAMATLSDVEHDANVAARLPVLKRAMRTLSNVRVRNVARVGGALAHGDPHMDLPPVLIALGAGVTIVSPGGERTMKVEDLLTGYYETALEKDELIAELTIPAQGARRAAYIKFTAGSYEDWPALGIAVSLDPDGDTVRSAIVVASAATARAVRLAGAEGALAGARIDDKVLARAGDAGAQEAE